MASVPLEKRAGDLRDNSAVEPARASRIIGQDWTDPDNQFLKDWQALADRSSDPNPFFEPWALLPALNEFAEPETVTLLAYYEAKQLTGVMPVKRAISYYGYPIPHLSAWSHDNAFCGAPLTLAGSEYSFAEAVHHWADARTNTGLFLHFNHLPEHGPFHAALRHFASNNHIEAGIVHREARAMLQSDQSPEEYFAAAISGKKRKELRRQLNRLSEHGDIRFDRTTSDAGLAAWIDDFLTLEAAGWKGREKTALSDNEPNERFFRATLTGAGNAGKLERLSLSLDNRPIAMLANFLTPPGAFSFKTTFDENYARFSPGVLLQKENLDLLANPHIEWADSCAAADHPMIERIWRQKRSMVGVNIGLGGVFRKALFRQILRKETVPEQPEQHDG